MALSQLRGPGLLLCAQRPVLGFVDMVAEAHRQEPARAAELFKACLPGVTMWLAEQCAMMPSNQVRCAAYGRLCWCHRRGAFL